MNERQMIDEIDAELEKEQGYGLTDDEVWIIQRVYEKLAENNNE